MYLKTNLHFHANYAPKGSAVYSFEEGIKKAAELNYQVIALTPHNKFIDNPNYSNYAEKNGILLIKGIELTIQKGHVLILNANKEVEKISSFKDLEIYKKENPAIFIIAPHPYFKFMSLGANLEKYIHLFDAIEHSWFYSKKFNLNKKAVKISQKYNLPLIATSDTHLLNQLKNNYAVVEAEEKSAAAIFKAIKNKNFRNFTTPAKFFSQLVPYTIKIPFQKLCAH